MRRSPASRSVSPARSADPLYDGLYRPRIEQGDVLVVDNLPYAIASGPEITIRNTTQDDDYIAQHRLSARQVAMLLAGGLIPWLRRQKPTSPS
jgi:hypothetical protein